MSHFAQIDEDNYVVQVLVGDNNLPDEGYSWFVENFGGRWIQTSFNNNFRKNFAGAGFMYSEELDAFIAPKPFNKWVLNEQTCQWEAPVPKPEGNYYWDPEVDNWIEFN
jgi:hypothetical protein